MKLLGKMFGIFFCIFFLSTAEIALAKHKSKSKPKPAPQPVTINGIDNLNAEISHIIQSVSSEADVGVQVKSMKNGEFLYSRNEHQQFVPASIMKIITAQAALLYLGSDYKFSTRLATDAKNVDNGVINGNVYLINSGDPTLTYYDMSDLMVTLKAQQIHQINGNVYIDNTAYDQESYGPGWIWKDKRYCFAAPITASIINHNCLSFSILPSKVGQRASIVGNPQAYYSGIQNEVITKSRGASRSCYIHLTNNADGTISVSGCMPKGKTPQGVTTVIYDVVEYNKSMLRDLFKTSDIQVNGVVAEAAAPTSAQIIASHQSKPLHELITDMLKMSDNIIAGSLFKKIGELFTRQPGSWMNGSNAVAKILSQKGGIDMQRMNVLDGSGLSRDNRVTPSQMMQLLDFAYHHNETNYQFISALPVAGVDGTLKHRLSNIAWKVRAKTGTMSGVVSLAGYVVTKEKEPLAFVIIVNGHMGMGWKYKEMEDRIVTALAKYTRK